MGNFGAIVFAPLGGYLIDATSPDPSRPNFSASVYIYLALKVYSIGHKVFPRLRELAFFLARGESGAGFTQP